MTNELYRQIKEELKQRLLEEKISKHGFAAMATQARLHFMSENYSCVRCGRKEYLTIDHIIPMTLLEQFGLPLEECLDEDNFQLLCRSCNGLKGSRLDFANPKTKSLLKKYVDMIT